MAPGHPPEGGVFFISATAPRERISADYRLLTAHETFPGHHLLDTSRWCHQRRIRRHIEFPLFYEGWASFAEELLFETGFFYGPADRMLMAKRRFWRAIRGTIDYEIHTGRRSMEEAAALLVAEGMTPKRAGAMVRRYCLKPGYQLSYTIGRRFFRRLYDGWTTTKNKPAEFVRHIMEQGEVAFHYLKHLLRQGG
jgi:uncharacterized protein (DUF885 family)